MNLYLALLHYPVYNKNGEVVTTAITGFDLHDIARSAMTFGVKKYFVVNPVAAQLKFAERIVAAWAEAESFVQNWTRAKALARLSLQKDLDNVILEIENETGKLPSLVATSARPKGALSYAAFRGKMAAQEGQPWLLLFGTGWGMTDEILQRCDYVLEPIAGADQDNYNHLSVRSAVAIILDRLMGRPDAN
ncbi:MAG: RNA methyltransferase [Candidatus Margulisiibacteriota bacterium]